ncbi:MAG: lamin tail domain-containing protein [Candidatus Eisenbacteria bacterium]
MKKFATTFGVLAVLALAAAPSFAANTVRISQVYGGGGGTTASTFNQDYVEIFNNSGAAVNIGGWTIEYGSPTGNWGSSAANIYTFPANTLIQPCRYILVGVGPVGTGSPAISPTPDFTQVAGPSMGQTNGKVGLFKAVNSNLACGSELAGTLVDKVAYGTANCAEVTAVAALSTTTAAVRNGGGTTDTDNNVSDFTVVANATPRNSASPANSICAVTPTNNSTWGSLKSIYR